MNWKGGKYMDKRGYIHVKKPNHPYSDMNGYVREHRLVIEEYLSRYLEPSEVVHHKNGVKNDNRIENLELFSSSGNHISIERLGKPAWNKGKSHSEETRSRISKSQMGNKYCLGRMVSNDTKLKISKGLKRYFNKKLEVEPYKSFK